MTPNIIFVNRRKGADRRLDADPCRELEVDLFHRKRRKSRDRRADRSLIEDYYAFVQARMQESQRVAQAD